MPDRILAIISDDLVLWVKVSPNAKSSAIVGWECAVGETQGRAAQEAEQRHVLKIRLAAPPIDGKANKALCDFLAQCFGVPKQQVQLLSGETARLKRIKIINPPTIPPEFISPSQ